MSRNRAGMHASDRLCRGRRVRRNEARRTSATFPADNNASALIYELAHAGLLEAWVSPAILEEYADVLGDHPEFVAGIVESVPVCYPLTELNVIRHEPDNRFLECALAADVDFIVTVNTAPGHLIASSTNR